MQTATRALTGPGAPVRRGVFDRAGQRRAAAAAALVSLGAAWVHLAYAAPPFRQWWAYGAFFLATGIGQGLFAPLVLRGPRPAGAPAGLLGNAAIVGMYVLSRTTGPPLGPHAHVPEPAGTIDLATTGAEVLLIGVLLTLFAGASRRRFADVLLVAGALLWGLRLAGTLP